MEVSLLGPYSASAGTLPEHDDDGSSIRELRYEMQTHSAFTLIGCKDTEPPFALEIRAAQCILVFPPG